ncbi:hypothetical protein P8452_74642 [Trifolium repens]|nr:hypothetical protein P8452_74642 [Trifolium repens]
MTNMKFLSFMLLLLFLVFHFTPTSAQVPIYLYNFCENSTAKSLSTSYKSNVNDFVSWISSDSSKGTKFNHTIIGSSSSDTGDDVYGNYDCRFDIPESLCQFCVKTAARDLVQHCPNSVTSVIFYDVCIIRYSNENFFGKVSITPTWNATGTKNIKDSSDLAKVEGYIRVLIQKATIETNLSWAMDEFNLSNTEKRYGLAQCGRDIDTEGCRQCLEALLDLVPKCCGNKVSWEVVAPSCGLRFDNQKISLSNGQTVSSSKQNPANQEDSSNKKTLVIALVSALVAVALLCCSIYYYWRKNGLSKGGFLSRNTKTIAYNDNIERDDTLNGDLPMIPFTVIQQSTDNFSISSKLGEGGFGPVYKGTLPDGTEIAVKRLADTSNQGSEEFKNEVIFIAKLQHRNLVKLLGCCIEDDEKILVYEYMPNSSLDFHLFNEEKSKQLDWTLRLSIINGIARGLLYLHQDSRLRVIHRDMKASNVLLDDEMIPKISDFGLARTFEKGQNQTKTRRVIGTYGYMAPEYAMAGLFSVKSDVFSFGVLLLEIVYGKRNGEVISEHRQGLLLHTWKLWCEGKSLESIDPIHKESYIESEVMKCIHIGLLCVQQDAADRPTMSTVVLMLGSDTMPLPKPKQPAFSVGRMSEEDPSSNSYKDKSVDEVPITIVSAR